MNNADITNIDSPNACRRTPKRSSSSSSSKPSPVHHVSTSSSTSAGSKHMPKKGKTIGSARADQISKHSRKSQHVQHNLHKSPNSHTLVPRSRANPSSDKQRSFIHSQNGRVSKHSDIPSRNARSAIAAAIAASISESEKQTAPTPTSAPPCSENTVVGIQTPSSPNSAAKLSKPQTSEPPKKESKQSKATAPAEKTSAAANIAYYTTTASAGSNMIAPATTNPQCSCEKLAIENEMLQRRIARLIYRVQTNAEIQRTHGQRILRNYYEQKVVAIDNEHRRATTAMLNRQKQCFQEEMENLESSSRTREAALNSQLQAERTKLSSMASVISAMRRERDSVVERTEEVVSALQRNLAQIQARTTRLEHEKTSLQVELAEKRVLVDTLAAATLSNDQKVSRENIVAELSEDERVRKDKVIDALHAEIQGLRHRLNAEMEINTQLVYSIKAVEEKRRDDQLKHEDSLGQCKAGYQKDADRLGRLIASVIQDFANAPSEASTRSGSNASTEGGGREDSGRAGSIGTDGD